MAKQFQINLRKLAIKYTQKAIANSTGFSQASINNYISGTSEPSISFLTALKNAYGINIDDFLCAEYEIKENSQSFKFAGNYIMYYYNNSAYKGEIYESSFNTLSYGVLSVYLDSDQTVRVCASFFKDKKETVKLHEELKTHDKENILEKHHLRGNAYTGSLTSNEQNMFISLKNNNNDDECFFTFNNPPSKVAYLGGIGAANSISRGREQNPCIQLVLIARDIIEKTDGEIYHYLNLGIADIGLSTQAKDIITLIKNLHINKDAISGNLTDTQKELLVENHLRYVFNEIINANIFRFTKISNREDDKIYRILKEGK